LATLAAPLPPNIILAASQPDKLNELKQRSEACGEAAAKQVEFP